LVSSAHTDAPSDVLTRLTLQSRQLLCSEHESTGPSFGQTESPLNSVGMVVGPHVGGEGTVGVSVGDAVGSGADVKRVGVVAAVEVIVLDVKRVGVVAAVEVLILGRGSHAVLGNPTIVSAPNTCPLYRGNEHEVWM
jgi:hypothetical protein